MALKNLDNFDNTKIIDIENLIIGSGAGGSTTAFELLKKNKNSIILEEGPDINNVDQSNIGRSIVQLYKNNGATPLYSTNGGPLIGYGQGSCVGGSTYVNAGYFSSTPEWVFEDWIKENRTNISYSYFQELLSQIKSKSPGQVKNLLGIPYVKYEYNNVDYFEVKKAIERLTRFFLSGNAEFILFPVENSKEVKSLKDSENLIENLKINKLHLVSVHGMSSLRAGKGDEYHTDYLGKLKNFKNIFINDASILPGNTGESPQASIMSFGKNNIKNGNF